MEARDLRIGSMYKSVKFNIPVKCELSDLAELDHLCQGAELDSDIISQMFEPLELTEDRLIKLGFIKDLEIDYRWHLLESGITYDLDDNCVCIAESWEFGKRKYVHQLQNLYSALKEKELEMKES